MRRIALTILLAAAACGGSSSTTSGTPAPTGVTAVGGPAQIGLNWTLVPAATSYIVLRSDISGGTKTQIGTATLPFFIDAGLAQNVTEYYTVRAVGAAGTSPDSAETSATTAVESAPEHLVAVGDAGLIRLSWDGVGSGLDQYIVLRSDTSGGTKTEIGVTQSRSFTDDHLLQDTTEFYTVRLAGTAGTSVDSNEASATTFTEAPPTNLVATGGLGKITLTWNAAPGATAYSIGVSDVAGAAKQIIASTEDPTLTDILPDGSFSPTATRFYVVHASGIAGISDPSNEASATAFFPAIPTGLSTTPGNGSVVLTWAPAANAASYEVHRSLNGAAPISVGNTDGTSFRDAILHNGTTYQYTVRSISSGGVSAESAPITAQPIREICVSGYTENQIAVFNGEQSGAVTPTRTFGSRTGLSPSAIDVDPAHGEIFSSNLVLNTVTSHSEFSRGNAVPLRTLTGLQSPSGVAYDATDDRLLVATNNSRIETFERTASGPAAPVRTLSLLNGNPGQIVLTGPAHGDRLFVGDASDNQTIYVFSRTDSGFAAPSAIITSTALDGLFVIGYDPETDELLAGGSGGGVAKVVAFPASSNGPTAPTRVLSGAQTGMTAPTGLAVDSQSGLLHVIDFGGQVLTFPLAFAADANLLPQSVLSGPLTQLADGQARHGTFDPAQETVVVQNGDRLLVFDEISAGNAEPHFAISSLSTGLESPAGMAFDNVRGELIVANAGQESMLTAYDRTDQGDAAALRSLAIPFAGFGFPAVTLDPVHDEVIVAPVLPQIPVYARSATGNAAPLRTITGTSTQLRHAISTALDLAHDAIVVNDDGIIRRFARSFTDGNEAPLTSIQGALTGLGVAQGIFVDDANNEIVVANSTSVLSFQLTADGNTAPLRTLSVPNATDVFVDLAADELFVLAGSVIQVYARTATGTDAPLRELTVGALASGQRMTICD